MALSCPLFCHMIYTWTTLRVLPLARLLAVYVVGQLTTVLLSQDLL